LRAIGIGKGTHVAFLMGNSADLLLLYLALARVGAVAAPINPEAPARLMAYYLDLCEATAVIADDVCLPALSDALSQHSLAGPVVVRGAATGNFIPFCRLYDATETDQAPFDVRFT